MFGRKQRRGGDICAIVVHAGAGYHSQANESVHLAACDDACRAAMACLMSNGSAVSAVEIAIKVLEDREITNAGYGSNLAMDGVVECDALVVDHMGRSGAVGACSQIKNPISLARLVLDRSLSQLTLRRVPPNLLVGSGAVEFADEVGIPILPYDFLVSPAARERWLRWTHDLEKAERRLHQKQGSESPAFNFRASPVNPLERDIKENREREAHMQKLLGHRPVKKARMSDSSSPSMASKSSSGPSKVSPLSATSIDMNSDQSDDDNEGYIDISGPPGSLHEASSNALINSTQNIPALLTLNGTDIVETYAPSIEASIEGSSDTGPRDMDSIDEGYIPKHHFKDGSDEEESSDVSDSASTDSTMQLPSLTPSPPPSMLHGDGNASADVAALASEIPISMAPLEKESPPPSASTPLRPVSELPPLSPSTHIPSTSLKGPPTDDKDDDIIDTVGAIAIDSYGNIASGASSGGIGMKHRGRVGPAALVGVGAAVVPVHPNDKSKTCISSITSGTGEHMGTTLAASVCADRLYTGMQKGKDGPLEPAGEESVLKSFIEREFMAHPSVKNSNSAGAIGVVSVKKTKDGVWLYFAHNTDSFALASMSSEDKDPVCAMSRTRGNATIAEGARSIRFRRKAGK